MDAGGTFKELMMRPSRKTALAGGCIALGIVVMAVVYATAAPEPSMSGVSPPPAAQPALTVAVTRLQPATVAIRIPAAGNIEAWQETIVGTEAHNLRLAEVRVDVGDIVRRGQVLATFATETVDAELAQRRAAVAEADVAVAEAAANARRAGVLQESGALSAQQIQQYAAAERTARARLDAARAVEKSQRLRLAQTRIAAPDDGIISGRAATVGAVVPAGQELFRLIRGGRLEWRAEVPAADLSRLRPGQKVRIRLAGGAAIEGRLRLVAPVVDTRTRNGLVYVDLPTSEAVRAGMFARGEFELGSDTVMTLPQSAVQLRDGFSYVMRVGPDFRVVQTKVGAGQRSGDRVEITGGLDAEDRVVTAGAAFLGHGDLVRLAGAGVP